MKRADLIKAAVELLEQGTLPSTLAAALMRWHPKLTPEQAQAIGQAALTQRARERAREHQQRKSAASE